jgi:hypothetical protein
MFIIIYFTVTLIFIYINATGCYIREMKYPWKQDIPLCLIWPVTVPIGILAIIASESRP